MTIGTAELKECFRIHKFSKPSEREQMKKARDRQVAGFFLLRRIS